MYFFPQICEMVQPSRRRQDRWELGRPGVDRVSGKPKPVRLHQLRQLRQAAADVAGTVLAPDAELIDVEARWPERGMRAVAEAGLLGLHVPHRLGGLEQGMLALATVTEELGSACSATAMCYGMHCVASKVLAVKATPQQEERYLRPIAAGAHVTTLALSEPGTGVHFFLPRARFWADGSDFVIEGEKSFVTSGGYADSYVTSAVPPGAELDPGAFTCLVVDAAAQGLEWGDAWNGFGMRGNSSRRVRLNRVRTPATNLLGAQGDQIWYVFEIVAPYFLIAMAGVYLGIARAALEATISHLQRRTYEHTGESLSSVAVLSHQVAEMWTAIERSRQLVHHAARLGDAGAPDAQRALFAAKIDVADTVVAVTNLAMMMSGGRGYQENNLIARLLRDAQAAHVMSPTTHLLKTWLGRSLLGLPML
jgi:isovaleryl-CoA dehydrogenase